MSANIREEILDLLSKTKPELESRYKVQRIALFGSYARGDQSPDSDVDILVEVDTSVGLAFVDLAERIEEVLGLPVELVSHRAVKPNKMKSVEQDLIYV